MKKLSLAVVLAATLTSSINSGFANHEVEIVTCPSPTTFPDTPFFAPYKAHTLEVEVIRHFPEGHAAEIRDKFVCGYRSPAPHGKYDFSGETLGTYVMPGSGKWTELVGGYKTKSSVRPIDPYGYSASIEGRQRLAPRRDVFDNFLFRPS